MTLPASVPRLIAITDRSRASARETLERFERVAFRAAAGSVVLRLRDPELPVLERLSFGRELANLARAAGQYFQVTDRLDLALLLGADCFHLAETSVSAADARRIVGDGAFLTRACHDPERVFAVEADAVVLSPLLEARKGRAPLGLGALSAARAALQAAGKSTLLYALGGIDAETAASCLAAGADGVAVIGAVLSEPRPERIIDALGCVRA